MDAFAAIADLPVEIDSHELEPRTFETPRFARTTTTVVLHGAGHVGQGEDVSYDPADQTAHVRMHALPLVGTRTLAEWSAFLDEHVLVPDAPAEPATHDHRRWAYESALLDLALRQADTTLGALIGRQPEPVRFCVSSRLGPLAWHAVYPDLEFKADAEADWDDAHVADLAALDRVRVVDLKAHYAEDLGQGAVGATMVERVIRLLPDAIIEDPPLDDASMALLADELPRVAFDAPVHRLADAQALPPFGCLNLKPSRFGTLRELFATIAWAEARGMVLYGGGQFELGVGRRQIQELAALFHPNGPNDVAPISFNAPTIAPDLPTGRLEGLGLAPGFGAVATRPGAAAGRT